MSVQFGRLGHGSTCLQYHPCIRGSLLALTHVSVQFGQLGHGSTCPEHCPHQVEALEGAFFGQLGHGSTCPEYHPRQVEALEGMFVTAVACGWWHTAAIAYGSPDADGDGGHQTGSNPQVRYSIFGKHVCDGCGMWVVALSCQCVQLLSCGRRWEFNNSLQVGWGTGCAY
eukprot:1066522-Pelagomonas_calceolata.AAC.3